MINPSLEELSRNGKYNRYTLCIATAKCARKVNDDTLKMKEYAENTKDADGKPIVKFEDSGEKPVNVAINRLNHNEYRILEPIAPETND